MTTPPRHDLVDDPTTGTYRCTCGLFTWPHRLGAYLDLAWHRHRTDDTAPTTAETTT